LVGFRRASAFDRLDVRRVNGVHAVQRRRLLLSLLLLLRPVIEVHGLTGLARLGLVEEHGALDGLANVFVDVGRRPQRNGILLVDAHSRQLALGDDHISALTPKRKGLHYLLKRLMAMSDVILAAWTSIVSRPRDR